MADSDEVTPDAGRRSVAGLFDDPQAAEEAVNDLLRSGFNKDQVGISRPSSDAPAERATDSGDKAPAAIVTPASGAGGLLASSTSGFPISFSSTPVGMLALDLTQEDVDYLRPRITGESLLVLVRAGGKRVIAQTVLERNGGIVRRADS